jgi:endonuclease-8
VPEGDTLFKVAAYLEPRLRGRRLTSSHAGSPPVDLSECRIDEVRALGKHLLIAFDDGRVLRSHLGMWGSWHWYPPGARWRKPARQARIVLNTGDAVFVCFNPREVEILGAGSLGRRVLSARLGPDLLAGERPLDTIVGRARTLAAVDAIIADVLLDQRIACGIGNVFKSEVLFLERTAPALLLSRVCDERLTMLYSTARDLLKRNAGPGPRVTRPRTGEGARHWVYGRRSQPCFRCGAPIRYARMGRYHRSTYWCPGCLA